MKRSSYLKAGGLLALVIAAIVVQVWVGLPDREQLRSVLDGLGLMAIPAFIGVYVAITLFPAGPTAVLTILAGVLLGFGPGVAAVLVAAVIGATVSFFISRALGRDFVRGISNDRVRALDAKVGRYGFGTALLARLIPLVPFSSANYAFGLTSVAPRPYVLATALGIVPGTTIYVAVGAYGATPGSWPFVLAVIGLVLLSALGLIRSRRNEATTDLGSSTVDATAPVHG